MDKILGCLSKPSSAAEHEEDDKNVEKMFAGCASTKKELGASNPTSNVGLLAKHGRETDGRIIAIQLKKKELTGSINFAAAPRSLVRIDLSNNALTGRLDLTELPLTLCFLDVRNNKFAGTVDLTRLPNELIELNFTNNELSGVLELGSLPKKLVALYANGNKFTAVATSSVESIKAAKLEADVRRCRGDSDSAVVETEPKNDTAFVLAEGSSATDDFKIERLPKSLRYLNLLDNPFTAGRAKPDTIAVDYMLWW